MGYFIFFSLVIGGIVAVKKRSEPKPYSRSMALSIGISFGLAVLVMAVGGAVESYHKHSDIILALGTAFAGGLLYGFGAGIICGIAAIIGCLFMKFALHENKPPNA